MWSISVGQYGTPVVHDDQGVWRGTFKFLEDAQALCKQRNEEEQSRKASVQFSQPLIDPSRIVWK